MTKKMQFKNFVKAKKIRTNFLLTKKMSQEKARKKRAKAMTKKMPSCVVVCLSGLIWRFELEHRRRERQEKKGDWISGDRLREMMQDNITSQMNEKRVRTTGNRNGCRITKCGCVDKRCRMQGAMLSPELRNAAVVKMTDEKSGQKNRTAARRRALAASRKLQVSVAAVDGRRVSRFEKPVGEKRDRTRIVGAIANVNCLAMTDRSDNWSAHKLAVERRAPRSVKLTLRVRVEV